MASSNTNLLLWPSGNQRSKNQDVGSTMFLLETLEENPFPAFSISRNWPPSLIHGPILQLQPAMHLFKSLSLDGDSDTDVDIELILFFLSDIHFCLHNAFTDSDPPIGPTCRVQWNLILRSLIQPVHQCLLCPVRKCINRFRDIFWGWNLSIHHT